MVTEARRGRGEGKFVTWVEGTGPGRCAVWRGLWSPPKLSGRHSWAFRTGAGFVTVGAELRSRVGVCQVTEATCEAGQGNAGPLG